MVKKRLAALCADDNMLYFDENSRDVICSCKEMSILIIDLNNINLDYTNNNEDEPKILFMSDF